MVAHKRIDRICCVVIALCLVITILFYNAERFGVQAVSRSPRYAELLFDRSYVHTIDIVMEDWDGFLETCEREEYALCTVVIDGDACRNVGIRAKGNTSLTQVAAYGNDRYSFKIEFDHYDKTKSWNGLDKLCLNNIISDNTYMKDYLAYTMMSDFDVSAPLCSYISVSVNGEYWGLYLAVEGVEESFLQRNYGNDYGELYKPDSMQMGGGRGNGQGFDFDRWQEENEESEQVDAVTQPTRDVDGAFPGGFPDPQPDVGTTPDMPHPDADPEDMPEWQGGMQFPDGQMPENMQPPDGGMGQPPDGQDDTRGPGRQGGMRQPGGRGDMQRPEEWGEDGQQPENFTPPDGDRQMDGPGERMGGRGQSDDVLLRYTDDDYSSYENIFDNAKTDLTDADKDRLIASLKNLSEQTDLDKAVDLEQVIRYFVVHNFVLNFDSYTGSMIHNYYLYEQDGRLSMIPWDYNLAFGGFEGASDASKLVNYPIDTPTSGSAESRPMLDWILDNDEWLEQYHALFSQFLEQNDLLQEIARVREMIAPYVEEDPTAFCTYEEFEQAARTLSAFCDLRLQSIAAQLNGTIGTTGDTQTADTLIDTSGLDISVMGQNRMGGGPGQGRR